MKKKVSIEKIALAAMFAALTCVATMLIKVPSPLKGYLNLGDCVVLLSGWMLPPSYGFLAAGLGSALADMFSGYIVYAPATFIIKGAMALAAHYIFKILYKKIGALPSQIISGSISEIVMIFGYFVFEGFMYGFAGSVINIPGNAIQGVFGIIVGIFLIKILQNKKFM